MIADLDGGDRMQFFQELGAGIEQRWRQKNYSEEAFPTIAADALAEADAITNVDPWEIVRQLHAVTDLPHQSIEDKFSDLPVVLYHGLRFHIDVYFWLDGTTSIHQHGFSGAFQVLSGSSIHSLYSFAEEQKINPHFLIGRLSLKEVQLLKTGDIRHIRSGRDFVHSLFHLDRPSITLTIRTLKDPAALPQFDYIKPYVAVNPFLREISFIKQMQSVSLLLRAKHPEADSMISEFLLSSDFETAFAVLKTIFQYMTDQARERMFLKTDDENRDGPPEKLRLEKFFETARLKHGSLVDLIPPLLSEFQRQDRLIRLRKHVTKHEHRFFLALLLNISERKWLLDVVKQHMPQKDPVETVCQWVSELAMTPVFGMQEPNALGIKDFSDLQLAVLRRALKGAFSKEGSHSESEIEETMQSLRKSLLLKAILESPTSAAAASTLS